VEELREANGNGPRYDWAARTTAQVVNLLAENSDPKHVLYAKVLFLILHSMYAADAELNGLRFEPSDN
jgi:hypothetical protein